MRLLRVAALAAAAALVATLGAATSAVSSLPTLRPPSLAPAPSLVHLAWQVTPTGSPARLRGLAAVSRDVAWVAGSGGAGPTVLRTTDAGATWTTVGPPGTAEADPLDLRDIEATSASHAVVLASGLGSASRILVTDDGGATWTETFRNPDERAFYDCLAFSSAERGLAVSDPVDGVFRFVETSDGGGSWSPVNPDGMPAALPDEFALAASGTCLTAGAGGVTYLASGGETARVFTSQNRGHTWSVSDVPLAGGPSGGAMSVRFRDSRTGLAIGGDLSNPTSGLGTAAWTDDGLTWHPADPGPGGYRSAVAFLPSTSSLPAVAVAVGPGGSDVSLDAGHHWASFGAGGYDTVDCATDGACWAAGEQGRVARLLVQGR
jgi:photosystem II stability/assembly factor-like uncharacterized protein